MSTKAFGKFLWALSHRESPVLLDLGPVVGTNINFFGERLGCKFFVEDVYANVEKFSRENRSGELAAFLATRFPQPDASFDGILCWDIFDYLDKKAAPILAREMARLLKPGGALLGFFATVAIPEQEYTRFLVVDDKTFKHRPYPAARGRQQVLVNRDITRMFDGLTVWESFLLMTKTREIVFRKPEQKAAPGPEAIDTAAEATAPVPAAAALESIKPGGDAIKMSGQKPQSANGVTSGAVNNASAPNGASVKVQAPSPNASAAATEASLSPAVNTISMT